MKQHRIFESLEYIFNPLFPGFIAAGLSAGFASLISQFTSAGNQSVIYVFLSLINNAFTVYLPVWIGWQSASRFGASPVLGAMMGTVTILDEIDQIASITGINAYFSLLHSGSGGILAVLFGTYLLARLEILLKKYIPAVLSDIFVPLIAFVICLVPYIFFIMPLFGMVSDLLCDLISSLMLNESFSVRLFSGFIAASVFLLLTMMGMNYVLVTLYSIELETLGYISIYPVFAMAGASQVGMGLAVVLLASGAAYNKLRHTAACGIVPGILGIGTPLLYGVSLTHPKLLLCSCLGAGFGGAFIVASGVVSVGWGPSGLLAVPLMSAGRSSALESMLFYVLGLLISFTAGFILTLCFSRRNKSL